MRFKLISMLFIALFSYMASNADDRHLEIPEITIPSGSVVDFQIDLVDDELTLAFSAEIDLPDGFTILPQVDKPSRTQYTLNMDRNDKMTFEASYPYQNNDVRLILMTADNSAIKGKTGWVVKLPMTTAVQPGTYEAKVHLIHMTYPEGNSYKEVDIPEITVKITVTEPEEVRYTDNQLFCNDIEINQGENAELKLSYNSISDVYEYSADVVLPKQINVDGNVIFSDLMSSIENFTNSSSWDETAYKLSISGEYGGKRNPTAPSGVQELASVKLNTAALLPGEYEIKVTNQALSNNEADYTPAEYVGTLIVKATTQAEKCATPVISVKDNRLFVNSDTEGASYHTSIVANDHKTVVHGEDPIELGGQYLVTTYASADGYRDSEPVAATLIWNKKDDISVGSDEIEMGTDRMILLQSSGDSILISGVSIGESLALYEISGTNLYQGNADREVFVIPYSCVPGQIYIVKVGNSTFKYQF